MNQDGWFRVQPAGCPVQPGIYLVKDSDGKLLWVGMAVNLRRRLTELFGEGKAGQRVNRHAFQKMPHLLSRVAKIDLVVVDEEAQRVHLTNHLIHTYRPYFNLATFLEVTGYAYIHLTGEPFPRFVIAEHRSAESAVETFGPYPTGPIRTRLLKCLNDALGLRTCAPLPDRACSLYAAGRCSAPCEGHISPQAYDHLVDRARDFLRSPFQLIDFLEAHMHTAAQQMQFEKAGALRDDLQALRKAFKRVRAAPTADRDQDVVLTSQDKGVCLHLKHGWFEGFAFFDASPSPLDGLARYYSRHELPQQIIVPEDCEVDQVKGLLGCPVTGPSTPLEQWALVTARVNHHLWVANESEFFEL